MFHVEQNCWWFNNYNNYRSLITLIHPCLVLPPPSLSVCSWNLFSTFVSQGLFQVFFGWPRCFIVCLSLFHLLASWPVIGSCVSFSLLFVTDITRPLYVCSTCSLYTSSTEPLPMQPSAILTVSLIYTTVISIHMPVCCNVLSGDALSRRDLGPVSVILWTY